MTIFAWEPTVRRKTTTTDTAEKSDMTYDEVRGPMPRYWKVTNPDPRLDLRDGDLLLFEGKGPSAITRLTPTPPPQPRNPPVHWAQNCTAVTPLQGFDFAIQGELAGVFNYPLRIDFRRASDTAGAVHSGSVTFPPAAPGKELLDAGTWMADEGP